MSLFTPKDATNSSRAARLQADDRGIPSYLMVPRIGLILCALALVLVGFVMVFSASRADTLASGMDAHDLMVKQMIFSLAGAGLCIVLAKFIPFEAWHKKIGYVVYGLSLALLVLVLAVGNEAYGAQRWVTIFGFTLQPSEFAKIGFIIVFASFFTQWVDGELDARTFFWRSALFIVGPLLFLYETQSDLGTTMIILMGMIAVCWIGGMPLRMMAIGVGMVAVMGVLALVLMSYRMTRLQIWLNPWADPLNAGFQVIRSFYAFSEGGIFGVGLGNSHEKFYLPMAENDMIYAVIGEELGLMGAVTIIVLFLLFLFFGLRIARCAPSTFGRLLASGLTVMIVFQAFLNMSCAMGLFPLTGKPLPFISAGGSSLISSFLVLGLILSVSVGSNVLTEYEKRRNNLNVISVHHGDEGDDSGSYAGRGGSRRVSSQRANTRARTAGNRSQSRMDMRSSKAEGLYSSTRSQRDFQRGSRR